MTLPRSTMATASQVRSTSSRRWEDSTTVRPSATSDRIMSRMSVHPGRVEPVHRLVQDQQLRVAEQAGGDAQALAHAHRVLRRPGRRRGEPCRPAPAPARCGPARRARVPPPESAGSACPVRWPWNRGSSTMAPTRARARVAMPRDRVSEQGHRASIGMRQSQQHPDERGLAGAVGAEVAEGAIPGGPGARRRSRRCSPRSAW